MTVMSLRRNDSSTAFLSHWLTRQSPFAPRSATRACAAIEQIERGLDRLAYRPPGRRADVVALLESRVDGFGEIGRHAEVLGVCTNYSNHSPLRGWP